jgi:hypothetical protein
MRLFSSMLRELIPQNVHRIAILFLVMVLFAAFVWPATAHAVTP